LRGRREAKAQDFSQQIQIAVRDGAVCFLGANEFGKFLFRHTRLLSKKAAVPTAASMAYQNRIKMPSLGDRGFTFLSGSRFPKLLKNLGQNRKKKSQIEYLAGAYKQEVRGSSPRPPTTTSLRPNARRCNIGPHSTDQIFRQERLADERVLDVRQCRDHRIRVS